jgi:large subunit ribosomal protein L5
MSFPEIKADEVEKIHGLQITVITSAKNKEEGLELLKLLGFPFRKE